MKRNISSYLILITLSAILCYSTNTSAVIYELVNKTNSEIIVDLDGLKTSVKPCEGNCKSPCVDTKTIPRKSSSLITAAFNIYGGKCKSSGGVCTVSIQILNKATNKTETVASRSHKPCNCEKDKTVLILPSKDTKTGKDKYSINVNNMIEGQMNCATVTETTKPSPAKKPDTTASKPVAATIKPVPVPTKKETCNTSACVKKCQEEQLKTKSLEALNPKCEKNKCVCRVRPQNNNPKVKKTETNTKM